MDNSKTLKKFHIYVYPVCETNGAKHRPCGTPIDKF